MKGDSSSEQSSDNTKDNGAHNTPGGGNDKREDEQRPQQSSSNSGRTKSGREQIEELIRSLNIISPKKPTVTSLPGSVAASTSASDPNKTKSDSTMKRESKAQVQVSPISSQHRLSARGPAFDTQNPIAPRKQGTSPPLSAPLPIGTEKKLGLLEKPHKPSEDTFGSVSPDNWGLDLGAWYRTTNHTIPIPPQEATQVMALQLNSVTPSVSGSRRSNNSTASASSDINRTSQSRRNRAHNSDDHSVRSRGREANQVGHRRISYSSTSSGTASGGSRSLPLASPPTEEYEFADSITTPAYGTYLEPYDRSRRISVDSPHPYQTGSNESPYYPPTRAAQQIWENNIATQGRRRSSVPASALRQPTPTSHATRPTGRTSTRDPALLAASLVATPTNAYNGESHIRPRMTSAYDMVTPQRQNQARGNSPTHRFSDPGPERDLTYGNWHMSQMEARQLAPVAYNNSGMLPAAWPTQSYAPPDLSAMAPGDWLCEQIHCGYHNFQRNADCRACGHPRTFEFAPPPPPPVHHSNGNPPLGSVGDWRCECGYINWRRRALCKNCYPNHPSNQDRGHIGLSSFYPSSAPSALNDIQMASVTRILDEANGRPHLGPIGSTPNSASAAVTITPPTYTRQAQELAHASFNAGSLPESSRQAQERYQSARSAHERIEWDGTYRG
ncbi:hypothetical protein I317_00939 [Kwoniella heveanensis CBS 569]|nr:hypothetical protein I317_00939 [Kwoniella heveanensis CBS 569]